MDANEKTNRRSLQLLGVVTLLLSACEPPVDGFADPPSAERLTRAQQCVYPQISAKVVAGAFPRDDGYSYTVDVAQLLELAALRGEEQLYRVLRKRVLDTVVISAPGDPLEDGFVAWRYADGLPLDATGTTEALRVASGLWLGRALVQEDDTLLVSRIAHGYARHAYVDQGTWMIRNYYNLIVGAFSINSYMVDYDPDLLSAIATERNDAALADVAKRSYQLIDAAVAPSGLIYQLVQPEVVTLLPGDKPIFSPNDIVSVANSCTVAERALQGRPAVARRLLAFARQQRLRLSERHLGASGRPIEGAQPANVIPHGCLARLAIALSDEADSAAFHLAAMLDQLEPRCAAGEQFDLYTLSEVGRTLALAVR
jgi:hypothetical protein